MRSSDDVIRDLQAQIEWLEGQLGDLHSGEVNSLKRANASLAQHVRALELELNTVVGLAAKLQDTSYAVEPGAAAQEASKTVFNVFLGHVFTYWLRSTFHLSRPVCRCVFAGIAGCTLVPLGIRVSRKLTKAVRQDSTVSCDFAAAVKALQERVWIMRELTDGADLAGLEALASGLSDGASDGEVAGESGDSPAGSHGRSNGDDLVHIGPRDWAAPEPRGPPAVLETGHLDNSTAHPAVVASTDTAGSGGVDVVAVQGGDGDGRHAAVVVEPGHSVSNEPPRRSSFSFLTFSKSS